MNNRLHLQLKKIARVLPLLERAHVPVYRAILDANRPAPQLHTGTGPYGWISIGFGIDDKGAWTDYSAWLLGVELYHRARHSQHPRPFRHREEVV